MSSKIKRYILLPLLLLWNHFAFAGTFHFIYAGDSSANLKNYRIQIFAYCPSDNLRMSPLNLDGEIINDLTKRHQIDMSVDTWICFTDSAKFVAEYQQVSEDGWGDGWGTLGSFYTDKISPDDNPSITTVIPPIPY